MTHFEYWLNEVADMPVYKDGKWYDLETGIEYKPERKNMSANAINARKEAKEFGGNALKGTKKQTEWAEKIRAEKIRKMNADDAKMVVDPNGLLTHSKFWIEQREKSATEIADFVRQQKGLLKKAMEQKGKGDADGYEITAKLYNMLTAEWGF